MKTAVRFPTTQYMYLENISWDTYERLGSPEGEIGLVQCVVYLGTAPKSNAVYVAEGVAKRASARSRCASAA